MPCAQPQPLGPRKILLFLSLPQKVERRKEEQNRRREVWDLFHSPLLLYLINSSWVVVGGGHVRVGILQKMGLLFQNS